MQAQQAPAGEGDLLGQARGVVGGVQTGHERVAIAVVLRADLAVDAHLASAGAQAAMPAARRSVAPGVGRRGDPAPRERTAGSPAPVERRGAGQRAAADRAALDEAVMTAEGGHG